MLRCLVRFIRPPLTLLVPTDIVIDLSQAIWEMAKHVDRVLVFLDPHGQVSTSCRRADSHERCPSLFTSSKSVLSHNSAGQVRLDHQSCPRPDRTKHQTKLLSHQGALASVLSKQSRICCPHLLSNIRSTLWTASATSAMLSRRSQAHSSASSATLPGL